MSRQGLFAALWGDKSKTNEEQKGVDAAELRAKAPALMAAAGSVESVSPSFSDEEDDGCKYDTLFEAIAENDADGVKQLLAEGEDCTKQNEAGQTPVHLALNNLDILRLLLESKDEAKDVADRWRNSPLHYAAHRGHKGAADILIAANANINAKNDSSSTPLHMAAQNNHADVVTALLEANASYTLKNSFTVGSKTALEIALETGGDVLGAFAAHAGVLHHAAANGNLAAVQALVAADAEKDATNGDGNTALHLAVTNNRADVVAYLLEQGADYSATNNEGKSAFDLAVESGNAAVIAKFAECPDILHTAAAAGNQAAVQALVEAGAEKDVTNADGNTALHMAVANNKTEVVEYLLAQGADVDAVNPESGKTALHIAAEAGNIALASCLISHAANLQKETHGDFYTPVQLAAYAGRVDLMTLLVIELGRDPNLQNSKKETPLHAAARGGHQTAVHKLMMLGARSDIKNSDEQEAKAVKTGELTNDDFLPPHRRMMK